MDIRRLLHTAAFVFIAAGSLACYFSAPLTRALTGISVPTASTVGFVVFLSVQTLSFASAVFLNAFEQIHIQVIGAVLAIPLFFGTAFLLFSAGCGISSVPLASSVAMLPSLLACYLVARRLIAKAMMSAPPESSTQLINPQ